MYKSRIKRLEERVEALEKALASKLDWDTALERIKEANRSERSRNCCENCTLKKRHSNVL